MLHTNILFFSILVAVTTKDIFKYLHIEISKQINPLLAYITFILCNAVQTNLF